MNVVQIERAASRGRPHRAAPTVAIERAKTRCWLEVDLDAVGYNYCSAAEILGGKARIIPVLKANAYGLGAVAIACALYELGATLFSVATIEEALEIKRAVPDAGVLAMGWLDPSQTEEAIAEGIILTVYSPKPRNYQSLTGRSANSADFSLRITRRSRWIKS